ncbi:LysR family transcriptional regulator [Pseudoalteromonas piscicida]|uniref:LysR family transcriptional regulator n=1 Tax=Pseudoalteromonas piscicida TaxID=43662 RepID=UPI003094B32F
MFSHLPSLNNLKTFAVAAHYLSFKKAAQALNVTPTAVSHQIKSLESQLRVQLFERQTRAIKLTPQGKVLAVSCIDALNMLDNACMEFNEQKNNLVISCCNSFAALWFAPNMAMINRIFPNQIITISASDQLIDLDKEKHIDIALRYGLPNQSTDEIQLVSEQIGLYCSANYQVPEQGKPTLFVTHWQESVLLENIPWQTYENQYVIHRFEQEHFVLQAALAGQGMALMSNVLAYSALKQGWLRKINKIKSFEGYSYWMRRTHHRKYDAEINRFSHWLEQELQERHAQ